MGTFDNFFTTELPGEIISSLIVMGIIAILAIIIGIQAHFHDPLKKPKGLLLVAEYGVEFFDNFTENLIGKKLPGIGGLIMALASYLFLSFIFGLTGLPSPATNLAVPLSLGLTTFLGIHIVSIRKTKWAYFKRYIDPFPFFLPVNLISMWAPLLSLSLRLFGNAVAGWTLMTLVYGAMGTLGDVVITWADESLHLGSVFAPMLTSVLHAYFDLFSAFIQTTVFISLSTIFLGQEVPDIEE
ncbi:MAG: F0F1 ATP synthase subunit A [Bacilli bacterium]|nr:F0F1 ATP synthase subunit A [Bacilli bacterium]